MRIPGPWSRRREVAAEPAVDLRTAVDVRAPAGDWDDDRPRILVVDDEPDIRAWLRVALREHGWHVNAARSVAEGDEMALRLHPHVALVDQRLPDGAGIELGRRIRERQPDVRVVMFSAYLDLGTEEEAAQLGIRTISKVDRTALFATLAAVRDDVEALSPASSVPEGRAAGPGGGR